MASDQDQNSYSKNWVFTLNNPGDQIIKWPATAYKIIGKEVGENGTPHLQGYVCFINRIRLTGLKKIIPRAHWEVMRGKPIEASEYCKKDGDFVEDGILPARQGHNGGEATKEKYKRARALAIAGDLEEIEPDIYIKHYNTLKRIKTDHQQKVSPIPELNNEWHYGTTGTGKSRYVREKYPNAFIKDANKWWDGYNGEEVVIVEDVDKYDVKLGRYIKLWGDHYAFPADMKNQGKTDIRPKIILITSNYTPDEIWCDPQTYEAVNRRYKLINYN